MFPSGNRGAASGVLDPVSNRRVASVLLASGLVVGCGGVSSSLANTTSATPAAVASPSSSSPSPSVPSPTPSSTPAAPSEPALSSAPTGVATTAAVGLRPATLFHVIQAGPYWSDGIGAAFVGLDSDSVYLEGPFGHADMRRYDRATLTLRASAALSDLTSVALGDGALWYATGHAVHKGACDCTAPPQRRDLLALDPLTLAVRQTLHLAQAPLLVAATTSTLWVATPDLLERLDARTGGVLFSTATDGYPIAVSTASDGRRLYLSSETSKPARGVVSAYDTTTGALLGRYAGDFVSDSPAAVTSTGIWVNLQHGADSGETTVQQLLGDTLGPGVALSGFDFVTQPYLVGARLWLVDRWGNAATVCVDPVSGRVLGAGPALGSTWDSEVIGDSAGTFALPGRGMAQQLEQVRPTTCE